MRFVTGAGQCRCRYAGATASLRGGKGFAAFAAAEVGLRAIAQSMARELGPQNIHVVHLILDGAVNSAAIHRRIEGAIGDRAGQIPAGSLAADAWLSDRGGLFGFAHMQTRDAWTHELDLRPSVEPW